MKVTVLQVAEKVNKKTGEVSHSAVVLGEFSNYGTIEPATVKIKLTPEDFATWQTYKGKKLDVEVVVPLPEYPLTLISASVIKSN